MKVQQLHINRFGHFHEYDLPFPGDGLQVIYGPNEAGKTTLLEFLRGLLFDFPSRTPYDFGGQGGEIAGVATLELRNRQVCELRRRKGNKNKVSIKFDGQLTNIDDAGWLRLLDKADRNLFESVFAFGLADLSQGESSLKHESLQSALFGGSLGGGVNSPDKVSAELTREADDLFKKGGSKPAINAHLAEIKRLTKEIKDRSLRPETYHESEKFVAKAAESADALRDEVDRLRREHSKVEKLLRAGPKWWELQQRFGERRSLIVPQNVPIDARRQYLDMSHELKSFGAEQLKRKEEIRIAELGLAALKLDPNAISFRAEIKSCLELRQSFIEAKEDLPDRHQQRESMRQLIDRELADLCPGWSHEDLRGFIVDIATRAQIDRAVDECRVRTTQQTKLTAKQEADATNLERKREELGEFGESRDVSALVAILADEGEFIANGKQLAITRNNLSKLEKKMGIQVRKLTPPLPATTSVVHELPVPRVETITDFESQFASLRDQLRSARLSDEEDEARLHEINQSLATAISYKVIPSLNERDAARNRRDLGWGLVRRKYISSEQADDEIATWVGGETVTSLPEGYEQAVREADVIADDIYENANEVAKREGLSQQHSVLGIRRDQRQKKIGELERQLVELQAQWVAAWHPCGFVPLAPDAMLGWVEDRADACSSNAEHELLIGEQLHLAERIASFEQRLRSAYGRVVDQFSGLLASAKQGVDDAKDQQRRRSELQKEIRRLEKQLAKYDDELQNLAKRDSAATADWQALLSMLDFPDHWSMELAREVIDKLKATRVRLDGLPREDARITAMQARIEEFGKQARSLCQSIQPELLRDPPELAIKKLDEQFERAEQAQRECVAYSSKLTHSQTQLASLSDRCDQYVAELSRLFALADVTTETEFLDIVSRAENAAKLDREIEQLARDIDLIRAGDNREEFEQSLSTSELTVLEGQERDLKDELKKADEARTVADGEVALARDALNRLNGSEEVAILTEDLSRKKSLLTAEIDRYMPLVYARYLLNTAVRRFEKENQPEMISTVSRLLSQMTGGKYVEFDRTGSGKQNILIRRTDGFELTPDQLSTGTREQLYLAIRLAYVLHYCEQNEPLPIVIDDVLVNFDDQRARQTLDTLVGISQSTQVLFFTCHSHMVDIARDVIPGLTPLNLTHANVTSAEK